MSHPRSFVVCLIASIMTATTAWSGSAHADLLGHWTFDSDGSDSSGNGYDATLQGGAAIDFGDKMFGNGSLRLPSTGTNYAEVTGSALPGPAYHPLDLVGTDYTIATWFKATNTSDGNSRFVNKDDGNNFSGGYSLWKTNSFVQFSHNSGSNNTLSNILPVPLNEWHHAAVVFDADTATLTTYFDGVFEETFFSVNGALTADGDDPLWFGAIPVHGQSFRGWLDDVRIYDHALDQDEIAAVVAGTSDTANIPEPMSLASFVLSMLVGLIYFARRR